MRMICIIVNDHCDAVDGDYCLNLQQQIFFFGIQGKWIANKTSSKWMRFVPWFVGSPGAVLPGMLDIGLTIRPTMVGTERGHLLTLQQTTLPREAWWVFLLANRKHGRASAPLSQPMPAIVTAPHKTAHHTHHLRPSPSYTFQFWLLKPFQTEAAQLTSPLSRWHWWLCPTN